MCGACRHGLILGLMATAFAVPANARSMECVYDFATHTEHVRVTMDENSPNTVNLVLWNEGDFQGKPTNIHGAEVRGGFFSFDQSMSDKDEIPVGPIIGYVNFETAQFNMMFAAVLERYFLGSDPFIENGIQLEPFECSPLD